MSSTISTSITIEAQDLTSALLALGRQTGRSITYAPDTIAGKRSSPVRSAPSFEAALQQMLIGTGLQFMIAPDGSASVAQLVSATRPAPVAPVRSAPRSNEPPPEELIVTGTRIRGSAPVGTEFVAITRDDIDRSGYGSIDQVLQTLTQNATGGGVAQNYTNNNRGALASINLRGLGADATLILVNGRRLPSSRNPGDAADILQIPVAAIERVEVIPDGASAIYGSDAVGGVVNFRLKSSYEGAETSLRFGSVTSGGLKETQIGQTIGHAWDGGNVLVTYQFFNRDRLNARDREYLTADLRRWGGTDFRQPYTAPGNLTVSGVGNFVVPSGQNGTSLKQSQLIPGTSLGDFQDGTDIFPAQRSHNFVLTARQRVTDHVELFGDLLLSERSFASRGSRMISSFVVPASNPFRAAGNLFPGATITEGYDFTNDLGFRSQTGATRNYNGVTGVTFDLGSWRVETSVGFAREADSKFFPSLQSYRLNQALADPNPATAFNPFSSGGVTNPATIASIAGGSQFYTNTSNMGTAAVRIDGTLATIGSGDIKVAAGGEWRRETLSFALWNDLSTATPTAVPVSGSRKVGGVYGEFLVPLSSGVDFAKTDLSVAGRYDHYSDFGSTVNPKIGLSVEPLHGLRLRGSWGTSFKAPNLYSIHGVENYQVAADLNDPRSPTGRTTAILLSGGNPNLRRQHATTWSAGADYQPAFAPNLSIEATYFDIQFKDRIVSPQVNFASESLFPSLVRRNPPLSEILRYLADPRTTGTNGVAPGSIGAILDARTNNVASVAENGVDLTTTYRLDTRAGEFLFRAGATWILKLEQGLSETAPPVSIRNTIGNPLSFRARGGVTWTKGDLSAGGVVNFSNAYNDVTSVPRQRVDSFTTLDLNFRWAPGSDAPAWLRDTVFDLSVVNLFDTSPPFANNTTLFAGYDALNATPLGRFVALQVRKSF